MLGTSLREVVRNGVYTRFFVVVGVSDIRVIDAEFIIIIGWDIGTYIIGCVGANFSWVIYCEVGNDVLGRVVRGVSGRVGLRVGGNVDSRYDSGISRIIGTSICDYYHWNTKGDKYGNLEIYGEAPYHITLVLEAWKLVRQRLSKGLEVKLQSLFDSYSYDQVRPTPNYTPPPPLIEVIPPIYCHISGIVKVLVNKVGAGIGIGVSSDIGAGVVRGIG